MIYHVKLTWLHACGIIFWISSLVVVETRLLNKCWVVQIYTYLLFRNLYIMQPYILCEISSTVLCELKLRQSSMHVYYSILGFVTFLIASFIDTIRKKTLTVSVHYIIWMNHIKLSTFQTVVYNYIIILLFCPCFNWYNSCCLRPWKFCIKFVNSHSWFRVLVCMDAGEMWWKYYEWKYNSTCLLYRCCPVDVCLMLKSNQRTYRWINITK